MNEEYHMKVKVLNVQGINEALLGLSLSYEQYVFFMENVADKLAFKQNGHNKFLESIILWLDVKAPRYWWSEADTYRISTKQSESTIHTLKRKLIEIYDIVKSKKSIEYNLYNKIMQELEERELIEKDSLTLNQIERIYLYLEENKPLWKIKNLIPEGWLQRRVWCISAKTLQNIIIQRKKHKLPHWNIFIENIKEQLVGVDKKLVRWIDKNEKVKYLELQNLSYEKSQIIFNVEKYCKNNNIKCSYKCVYEVNGEDYVFFTFSKNNIIKEIRINLFDIYRTRVKCEYETYVKLIVDSIIKKLENCFLT